MAGNNDRIYSYNPVYRNADGPARFYSFERRNGQFINRQVQIVNPGDPALDHQGHIVPQNILNEVLDATMDYMYTHCPTPESAVQYVTTHAPWTLDTYNYGLHLNINMFDYDANDPEDRFGTFFSIVTWNPVNLCRAPGDDRRGGYPGNHIDEQVADYLRTHQMEQGIDPDWMAALDQVIADASVENITNYLNACCATLDYQLTDGIGYYQFPWMYQDGLTAVAETGEVVGVLIPSKK